MAIVGRGSEKTVRALIGCNRLDEILLQDSFRRILIYLLHVDGMYGTFSELWFL